MTRALTLTGPAEDPSLAVVQVDRRALGPHDVMVEVAACGFCYHDVAVMRGMLRRGVKPEIVLGHEISGHIAETGSEVTTVTPGDLVIATLTTFCGECSRCRRGAEYRCLLGKGVGHAIDGGFAELVLLPEASVVAIPYGVSPEHAALLACPIGVALRALQDVARVESGETVLVTGAGGGLGVHGIQAASALGARVLAVTTSPDKVERLEAMGVAEIVLADGELDYSEIVMALTEDNGVDVVFDTVGSVLFQSNLASLAQFGRMVLLGEITGGRVSMSPAEIMFRDATVAGSTGAERRHILKAAEMVAAGLVRPIISQTFALEDALDAYRLIRDKQTFGRVLLKP